MSPLYIDLTVKSCGGKSSSPTRFDVEQLLPSMRYEYLVCRSQWCYDIMSSRGCASYARRPTLAAASIISNSILTKPRQNRALRFHERHESVTYARTYDGRSTKKVVLLFSFFFFFYPPANG